VLLIWIWIRIRNDTDERILLLLSSHLSLSSLPPESYNIHVLLRAWWFLFLSTVVSSFFQRPLSPPLLISLLIADSLRPFCFQVPSPISLSLAPLYSQTWGSGSSFHVDVSCGSTFGSCLFCSRVYLCTFFALKREERSIINKILNNRKKNKYVTRNWRWSRNSIASRSRSRYYELRLRLLSL
jgi:hypothetical protein